MPNSKAFVQRITLLVCATCLAISAPLTPPKIIDCHVHHNGSEAFLRQLSAKLLSVQGMALLITAPKDLDQVGIFMRQHPGQLIGLGEIQLDARDVSATIDRFHAAGFRGLGEITKPQYSYDDRRYWPVYERAEKYNMIILFHTGIVNRSNPNVASDVSSDRMRASALDLIARRFPRLTVLGATSAIQITLGPAKWRVGIRTSTSTFQVPR